MKKSVIRVAPIRLLTVAFLLLIALSPQSVFADSRQISGDFTGKTLCQNGMKKAGFKNPATQSVTYYTLNEISHYEQALSWPQPDNPMSFDAREKQKIEMQHVLKKLRELSCDTQDNPAQSGNGLKPGTTDPTHNGVKTNGYVQQP